MVITVQGIIQGDSQADARSVDLLDTTPLNVPEQSSEPKASNGRSLHGRLKSTKFPRVRRAKERGRSLKGSQRARALRDLSHLVLRKPRLLEVIDLILKPNQKLDHAWQMTFYLQCQRSPSLHGDILHEVEWPVFKPGKWSFASRQRLSRLHSSGWGQQL